MELKLSFLIIFKYTNDNYKGWLYRLRITDYCDDGTDSSLALASMNTTFHNSPKRFPELTFTRNAQRLIYVS